MKRRRRCGALSAFSLPIFFALTFFGLSCGFKLPSTQGLTQIRFKVDPKPHALGDSTQLLLSGPTSKSDFSCFLVAVSGPGIPPEPRLASRCSPSAGATATGGFFNPGAIFSEPIYVSGATGAQGSVSLPIPSGTGRVFRVYGLYSSSGSSTCEIPPMKGTWDLYNLGEVTADVTPNTKDISVTTTFTSGAPASASCSFDPAPTTASSSMDLVVPIEMTDSGLASHSSGDVVFNRSTTRLNTGDYDGTSLTYLFEVVATNSGASVAAVSLVDSTAPATALASVNVPASQTNPLRIVTGFSPNAGDNTYKVKTAVTTSIGQVVVYAARILVAQTGATRTRLFFPLYSTEFSNNGAGNPFPISPTNSTTFTQHVGPYFNYFYKESNAWGSITAADAWRLDTIVSTSGSPSGAEVALFQAGTTNQVANSLVSLSSTQTNGEIFASSSGFSSTAGNFTDNLDFEAKFRTMNSSYPAELEKAQLSLRIDTLTKFSVPFRIGRQFSIATGGIATRDIIEQYSVINLADFMTGSLGFFESTASSSGTSALTLIGAAAATPIQNAVASTESFALPASKTRLRTPILATTLTTKDKFGVNGTVSGNGASSNHSASFIWIKSP